MCCRLIAGLGSVGLETDEEDVMTANCNQEVKIDGSQEVRAVAVERWASDSENCALATGFERRISIDEEDGKIRR